MTSREVRAVPKTGVVVAVDGPSASGKSTVSRALAERLALPYVNTGLMYRALAARALATGTDPDDVERLEELARDIRFSLSAAEPGHLLFDGHEPGGDLATVSVEAVVSAVSRHPDVRAVMRAEQRRLGASGSVTEGRDIGAVVFPDADAKLFLTASAAVRRERRERERGVRKDDGLARALELRDALDAQTNPLRPAPGAVTIDSTALSTDAVVEEALRVVEETLRRLPATPS